VSSRSYAYFIFSKLSSLVQRFKLFNPLAIDDFERREKIGHVERIRRAAAAHG
jgi:hypothetical protein